MRDPGDRQRIRQQGEAADPRLPIEPPTEKKKKPKRKGQRGSRRRRNRTASPGSPSLRVHWVKSDAPTLEVHTSRATRRMPAIIDDGEEVRGQVGARIQFYLNAGNKSLAERARNATKLPVNAVKKQFKIGTVLIGMALLHDDKQRKKAETKPPPGENANDDKKKTMGRSSSGLPSSPGQSPPVIVADNAGAWGILRTRNSIRATWLARPRSYWLRLCGVSARPPGCPVFRLAGRQYQRRFGRSSARADRLARLADAWARTLPPGLPLLHSFKVAGQLPSRLLRTRPSAR